MSKNSSSSSDASYLSCVKCLLPWSSFATCASAASVVPAAIDAPVSSCLRRAVQRDAAAMQLCAVAVLQRKTASAKAARRRSKPAAFAMVKKPAWKDAAADDSDDAVVGGGFGAPQRVAWGKSGGRLTAGRLSTGPGERSFFFSSHVF